MPSSVHSSICENGGLAMIGSARLIFATMKNGNRKKISIHT